jgi:Protein of unknown function (DUF1588)/Protein of unknown function (DUF1592)/Protein of unknown function (DUF1595)/Protein of unknown function (DUF1585)
MAVLWKPREGARRCLSRHVMAPVVGGLLVAAAFISPARAADDPSPKAASPATDTAPSLPRVRLLSQEQYFNSLGYIFGPDITVAAHFTPFRRTDGLVETGASVAGVTSGQIDEFQRTAIAIADQVVSPQHRSFLVPCTPKSELAADRHCAAQFIRPVGRLLYRRALTKDQESGLVELAGKSAEKLSNFYDGLAVALNAMLISPDFLFVIDRYEADPDHAGNVRLDGFSYATRLSLLLWNSGPDDELIRSAESGELKTPAGRARQVDRLLSSARLETGVRAFFDDMLGFDDLASLSKDARIYPMFSGVTLQDAREQTLRTIVDQLVSKKSDYRDLFTTRDTFISPSLAAVLQVPAPPGWSPYSSPEGSPRVGLLTQISFLSGHAHPGRSSPTLRGKALRELLLCQKVPRPPPNVDFSIIENPNSTMKTARERLTAHRSNPVCAGCHKLTDPIGLALENFDGAGQFREAERGAPIDASGSLDGRDYTDSIGLGQALHDHPALPGCLVRRVYSYAIGNPVPANDKVVLPQLTKGFADAGFRLPDLLRSIALSPGFSEVSARSAPAPVAANNSAQPDPTKLASMTGDYRR